MTRIDFYILGSSASDARLTLACRLADKAVERRQKVFINMPDSSQAARLDDLLWTFSQGSFIPHRVLDGGDRDAAMEPVLIGADTEPPGDAWEFMINLAATVPEYFSRYERVAELVDGDDERRQQGRERFKYYRDRGYELTTHKL